MSAELEFAQGAAARLREDCAAWEAAKVLQRQAQERLAEAASEAEAISSASVKAFGVFVSEKMGLAKGDLARLGLSHLSDSE